MEMLIVPVPGPDLVQPAPVAVAGATDALAERTLDRGVDEDAIHVRIARGEAQQRHLPPPEASRTR